MCASQAPIGDADGHTEGRDTDDVGRQTGSQDTAPCLRNLSMAGSLPRWGCVHGGDGSMAGICTPCSTGGAMPSEEEMHPCRSPMTAGSRLHLWHLGTRQAASSPLQGPGT